MKRFLALLFGVLMLAPAIGARAAEAPDALIERLSSQMLDLIKADKDLQAGDFAKLSAVVDSTVMPHVDFQRMTALAVGRNWRSATPEQQKRLMEEFRALLLRTYSGALSNVREQKIRMKPMRSSPGDTDVIVRTEVIQSGRDPAQLGYRLYMVNDTWKIYDVNVLGVWLVDTYRNQFAQEVSTSGIDGLIKSLTEKNQALDQAKRS